MVLDRDERLLEVEQEATDVAHDEDVEGTALGRADHRLPRGGPPRRGPATGGHRPLDPGIHEGVPLDGPVLLLALGVGNEVVPLARRGLAEPPGRPHPRQVVELAGQDPLHAAVLLSVGQGTVPSTTPSFDVPERGHEGEDDGVRVRSLSLTETYPRWPPLVW